MTTKTSLLVLAALLVTACAHQEPAPQTARVDRSQPPSPVHRRSQSSQSPPSEPRGPVALGDALAATAPRDPSEPAPPPAPSSAEMCASNRAERMQELAAHLAKRDRIRELRAWEEEHCQYVDNSVPVVRQVQDSRGEIHTVEGRSRGVDRKCNAPLPAELKSTYARDLSAGQPPYHRESASCQKEDIAASPVAARYYSESKRWY